MRADGSAVQAHLGLVMEHGTLWGHGACLGPDCTAEHLHREVGIARDVQAGARFGKAWAELSPCDQASGGSWTSSSGRSCWWWPEA